MGSACAGLEEEDKEEGPLAEEEAEEERGLDEPLRVTTGASTRWNHPAMRVELALPRLLSSLEI